MYMLEIKKWIYNLVERAPEAKMVPIFISCIRIFRAIAEYKQGKPCLKPSKSEKPNIFTRERAERLVRSAKERLGVPVKKLARESRPLNSTVS